MHPIIFFLFFFFYATLAVPYWKCDSPDLCSNADNFPNICDANARMKQSTNWQVKGGEQMHPTAPCLLPLSNLSPSNKRVATHTRLLEEALVACACVRQPLYPGLSVWGRWLVDTALQFFLPIFFFFFFFAPSMA